MNKYVKPKRATKALDVDEYWEIKNQEFQNNKDILPKQYHYKTEEVANRHRYIAANILSKKFRPLAMLQKMQKQQIESHVQGYLQQIHYRLPLCLAPIKKLLFTLPLILYSLKDIFRIIVENLHCDQAWSLLQAILKDTKTQSYEFFLNNIHHFTLACPGKSFDQSYFRSFFDTWCIFMQTNFNKITQTVQRLNEFFERINETLFLHSNKYMRNFSIESCSYLLNNTQDQFLEAFLTHMQHNLNHQLIAKLLVSRNPPLSGSLTATSLASAISHISILNRIFQKQSLFIILAAYLNLLFSQLQFKTDSQELVFDLKETVQALIKLQKDSKLSAQVLVYSIEKLYDSKLKKSQHQRYISIYQIFEKMISQDLILGNVDYFLQLFQQNSLEDSIFIESLYKLIGKCLHRKQILNNNKILKLTKMGSTSLKRLILNSVQQSKITKSLIKFIVLILSTNIEQYLNQTQEGEDPKLDQLQLLYQLIIIMHQYEVQSINLNYFKCQEIHLVKKIQKIYNLKNDNQFMNIIVFIRLISCLTMNYNQIESQLFNLYEFTMAPFINAIKLEVKQDNSSKIYLHTHRNSCQWIKIAISSVQCFVKCFLKFLSPQQICQKINLTQWNQYIIDRVSLIKIVNIQSINIQVLQSKHRQIRLYLLKYLSAKYGSNIFINGLIQIDSQDIDLQNQRNVRRIFHDLTKQINKQPQSIKQISQILIYWSIGFAYTGFNLINQQFIHFLGTCLENVGSEHKIQQIIFDYFNYYLIKYSRAYKSIVRPQINLPNISNNFLQMINRDCQIAIIQSQQWIGLNRIASTINISNKIKSIIKIKLNNFVNYYFQNQFIRVEKTINKIIKGKNQQNIFNYHQDQLKPPNVKFLQIIIKIMPIQYQPPINCIHYTLDYLQLPQIQKIKTKKWQLIWGKDRKEKQDNQTTIKMSNLSPQQQKLYLNFLFRQILKGNTKKRRIIIEHIRSQLPQLLQYFFEIYWQSLLNIVEYQQSDLIYIFTQNLINNNVLLNHIYILQSILQFTINYVPIDFIRKTFKILSCLLKAAYSINNRSIHNGQQQEQDDSDQSQVQLQSDKFKKIRSELYKSYNIVYLHYYNNILPQDTINLVNTLIQNKLFQQLPKAARVSLPGLLKLVQTFSMLDLQIICRQQILNALAKIWQYDVKQQSITCCVKILSRMFNVQIIQDNPKINLNTMEIQDHCYFLSSCQLFLKSIYNYLNRKWQNLDILRILEAMLKYCSIQVDLTYWQPIFWKNIITLVNKKKPKFKDIQYLKIILKICLNYGKKWSSIDFIKQLITILPYLSQIEFRNQLNQIVLENQPKLGLNIQTLSTAKMFCQTTKKGLQIILNFESFFTGLKTYQKNANQLSQFQHEYLMYNLLAHCKEQQISVRKAVATGLKIYLKVIDNYQSIKKILTILLQILRKSVSNEDSVFWSTLSNIGQCIRKNKELKVHKCSILSNIVTEDELQTDFFSQICSLSQSNKHKALKMLKQYIENHKKDQILQLDQKVYNNQITTIIVPILEHLIFPAKLERDMVQGNLASTLSHVSLQLYNLAMAFASQSVRKKQLKRIISKIKFEQTHAKKNIIIVRVIGQIVDAIDLPNTTEIIKKSIKVQGIEQFHQKINNNYKYKKQQDDEDDSINYQGIINEDLQEEDALNKNFIDFQKKLMEIQEPQQSQNKIIKFLKYHVLAPLKAMLFYQRNSKADQQEQNDKGRILLSVAVTKILIKFPLQIFMRQFQRVLSKLCRMLKKRNVNVRDSARKCLGEIAKIVGPAMVYSILREMKFHLRDNFEGHIFNYSAWHIINSLGDIPKGQLDYCLPLVLPIVVDEIFGIASQQKLQVDEGNIPTILMQVKKKKGYQLITLLCQQILPKKVDYILQYLSKSLKSYLNSQKNISRYQQLVSSILSGLAKNSQILKEENSSLFLSYLAKSINEHQPSLRIHIFGQNPIHDSTIKQDRQKSKKIGDKQVYILQEEAGRNKSIFRKITQDIAQKRNGEMLANCIIQFYLSFAGMLMKKQVLNSKTVLESKNDFSILINFVDEYLGHRNNVVVSKCLKILHQVLTWKIEIVQKIRKKVARKVLSFMEKLTSSDNQLLKECFSILNGIFSQINITEPIAQQLLIFLQNHITGQSIDIGLSQPYKLLRLVIYKHAKANFQSLYEYVRVQLINVQDQQIRQIIQNICSSYLRNYVDQHNRKNQLMFYLSNLDCQKIQAQVAVLNLIEEYVETSSKKEIELIGEVVLMGLATAYANGNQQYQKIQKIISLLLNKIDNSKVMSLMIKCTKWMNKANKISVRICGYYLLKTILQKNTIKLTNELKVSLQAEIQSIIAQQSQLLHTYDEELAQYQIQRKILKDQKQWQDIIVDTNQTVYFKKHECIELCTSIIVLLVENYHINLLTNQSLLEKIWILVVSPSQILYKNIILLLSKIKNPLKLIGYKKLIKSQQNNNNIISINKTLKKILSNQNSVIELIKIILNQIIDTNQIQLLNQVFRTFIHLIGHLIMRSTTSQNKFIQTLSALEILLKFNQQFKNQLLTIENNTKDLVWQIAKISRNGLVSQQIKQKNQSITQIVRVWMGSSQYYQLLSQLQKNRKIVKNKQKSDLAQLAITNQKLYHQQKSRKKRKIQ